MTTIMVLAAVVVGYAGSASAEYVHVFSGTATSDDIKIYIDFARIQVSKEQRQDGVWTRYMVPVAEVYKDSGTTYMKYLFASADSAPNLWRMYVADKDDSPSWYNISNWDAVKLDDVAADAAKNKMGGISDDGVYDLSDWNRTDTTKYHNGSLDLVPPVLKKTIQYEEGIITSKEPVSALYDY